jgi:hypothetical protein
MKKLIIILGLFGLILNTFAQSELERDIIKADQQFYIRGDSLYTYIQNNSPATSVLGFNFDYTFNSNTTDSKPGTGLFKLNNASYASVTQIFIDDLDNNSVDKSKFLAVPDTGSYISLITDEGNYVIYQLTGGVTDAVGYYKYGVTYVNNNGVLSGATTIDIQISNNVGGGGGTGAADSLLISSTDTLTLVGDTLQGGNINAKFNGLVINDSIIFDYSLGKFYLTDLGGVYVTDDTGDPYLYLTATDFSLGFATNRITGDVDKVSLRSISGNVVTQSQSSYYIFDNDTLFANGEETSTKNHIKAGTVIVDSVGFSDGSGYLSGLNNTGKIQEDTLQANNAIIIGSDTATSITSSPEYDSIIIEKTIRYNHSEGVHEFLTAKDGVVWQGALEDLFQFYNNTGATIPNGTPLYYSGVNGDSLLTCDYATAAIEFTVLRYAGMATGDVPNNDWGYGNRRGKIRGINTSSLSQTGAVFLGVDSLPTMTKPAHPNEVLILGGVVKVDAVDGVLYHDPSTALKRILQNKSYSFTSQGITSGTYYRGGYYAAPATDANLTQASTTITYGTANTAYSAHPFIVFGSASVNTGTVGLRVTGTSINDDGVLTTSDADTITTDITSLVLNTYYEVKKFVGTVTYQLFISSGTPTTYSLDFNYGYAKYEDLGNRDFYVTGIEVVGLASATDASFNVELLHHTSTGWTYSAAAFEPGNSVIASLSDDLSPYDDLVNGQDFAWKRTNINQFIDGNASDGIIIRITTGTNNTVQAMDIHISGALE